MSATARALSRSAAAAGALALALLAPPIALAGPRDPLYQWADERGAVRYTTEIERIPDDLRDRAIRVRETAQVAEPAAPPAQPAPAAPPAPAPVQAPPPETVPREDLAAIDTRIAELERRIAADEAAIGDHISDPDREAKQSGTGAIAEIAERLPRLHEELRELRARREAAIAPDER